MSTKPHFKENIPIFTKGPIGNAKCINFMYLTWSFVKKKLKKWTLERVFPHFMVFSTKSLLVIHGFCNSRIIPSPKKPRIARTPCSSKKIKEHVSYDH